MLNHLTEGTLFLFQYKPMSFTVGTLVLKPSTLTLGIAHPSKDYDDNSLAVKVLHSWYYPNDDGKLLQYERKRIVVLEVLNDSATHESNQ